MRKQLKYAPYTAILARDGAVLRGHRKKALRMEGLELGRCYGRFSTGT